MGKVIRYRSSLLTGLGLSVLLFLTGSLRAFGEEVAPSLNGQWEFFSLPQDATGTPEGMVIDRRGTPWVLAGGRLFYLKGTSFVEGSIDRVGFEGPIVKLVGGPDRGAYALQMAPVPHALHFYELRRGSARLATTIEDELLGEEPGVYVSEKGWLFVWNQQFLARYDGKSWVRTDAVLDPRNTAVFDLGERVHFYFESRLYRWNRDGSVEVVPSPIWESLKGWRSPMCWALWGDGTPVFILSEYRWAFSFDLETLQPACRGEYLVRSGEFPTALDAFPARDGSIWILGSAMGGRMAEFFRFENDGEWNPIESTGLIPWTPNRLTVMPQSILLASDGSTWFGLPEDGVAVYADNRVSRFNWRYGVFGAVNCVLEDRKGDIWCAGTSRMLARFRRGKTPPSVLPKYSNWESIPIVNHLWSTDSGEILLFRCDNERTLSRWNGSEWTYTPVPFHPAGVERSLVSDQGHLLVKAGREFYLVSRRWVRVDDSHLPLLVAAIRDRARSFRCGPGFQSVLVRPSNRIFSVLPRSSKIDFFDGSRWDKLSIGKEVDGLTPSIRHNVLARARDGGLYAYDRGVMVEVERPISILNRLVIGLYGFQPDEKVMFGPKPNELFPVWQENQRRFLFTTGVDFSTMKSMADARRDFIELPRHVTRLQPSRAGGGWLLGDDYREQPLRLIETHLICPESHHEFLAGGRVRAIEEDAAGNLWLGVESQAGRLYAFSHKLSSYQIEMPALTRQCGHQLRFPVRIVPPLESGEIRLMTRIDHEEWILQQPGLDADFRFARPGMHHCSVKLVTSLGGVFPQKLQFDIDAQFPYTGPHRLEVALWKPSVEDLFPERREGERILWRFDDEDWQVLSAEAGISFAGRAPGRYWVQFQRADGEEPRDGVAGVAEVEYAPDLERAVLRILKTFLASGDQDISQLVDQLSEFGPDVIPILEKRLSEATTLRRRQHIFENLLAQIRYETRER